MISAERHHFRRKISGRPSSLARSMGYMKTVACGGTRRIKEKLPEARSNAARTIPPMPQWDALALTIPLVNRLANEPNPTSERTSATIRPATAEDEDA